MDRTSLGLTKVEPGESIFEDRASFTTRNIDLIDRLLRLGASTHKHTAKPAISDPVTAPTLAVDAAGGTIPADTPIFVGFTALDDRGGETLLSPVANDVTPGGISDVPVAPTAVVDYTAGTLPANTYYYVLTGTDATGGETQAGGVATVVVAPGSATARVLLDGLLTAVQAIGATAWRLYRSTNGGQLGLLGQGATETFTDDGQPCLDPQLQPPVDSTTGGTAALRITVPLAALPADATGFRLYVSTTADFSGSNLLASENTLAGADVELQIQSLDLESGYPPPISTSLPEPEGGGAGAILVNSVSHVADEAIPAPGSNLSITLNQPLDGVRQYVEVAIWMDADDPMNVAITLYDPAGDNYGLTGGGGSNLDDPTLAPTSMGTGPNPWEMARFNDGRPAKDSGEEGGGSGWSYATYPDGIFVADSPIGSQVLGDDGINAKGDWRVVFESFSGVGTVHAVQITFGEYLLPRDGHFISDDGNRMPARPELDFVGFVVKDDPSNNHTTIKPAGMQPVIGINTGYAYPGSPQQNFQIDPVAGFGFMATAAAADMRFLLDTPPNEAFVDERWQVGFTGVAADDVVGAIVKALDIANFLAVRLDNTVPALEIVSVDAGVVTTIASLPLAAALTGRLWITGEIVGDELGVAVHTMSPGLSIAEPAYALGGKLTAGQATKYVYDGTNSVIGVGGAWIIAGAANTARVMDGVGAT